MGVIRTFINCMFGPRLYRVYKVTVGGRAIENRTYIPSNLERWGDRVVISFATIWSISLYAIPLVATFMYQRNYSIIDNVYFLGKIVVGTGLTIVTSLIVRGHARYANAVYYKFIKELRSTHDNYNRAPRDGLRQYDYDFWAMPLDYSLERTRRSLQSGLSIRILEEEAIRSEIQSSLGYFLELPYRLLAYIVAYTFAVKLIYPGSVSIVNWALRSTLEKGRIDLVTQGGVRFKLRTPDQNFIDTMFIDRRNVTPEGNMLVVCCEGNCGFYENGILVTPLKKGYSILGWNHPGFADSTGTPCPSQEKYAMDTVMRFAIDHLLFNEKDIIIYGWSIGGYTATFAAMKYPKINSLILDATFDHVLPLAFMAVPSYLQGLTRRIILYHFNLRVADNLMRCNGPVLIVRRTEDEIVCTPSNTLIGNRANLLLMRLLMNRYPYLFTEKSILFVVFQYILAVQPAEKKKILDMVNGHVDECMLIIGTDILCNGGVVTYPSELGKNVSATTKRFLILFLIMKYLKDQQSTHCVPLSENLFVPAWNPKSAYQNVVQSFSSLVEDPERCPTNIISEAANRLRIFDRAKRTKARKSRSAVAGTLDASALETSFLDESSLESSFMEAIALQASAPRTRSYETAARGETDQDASSDGSLDVYESDLETIDLAFSDFEISDEEVITPDTNTAEASAQKGTPERQFP